MKNIFIFFICLNLFLYSCTVQKRKYRPGYHTSYPAPPTTTTINTNNPGTNNSFTNTDTIKYLSSPFLTDSYNQSSAISCDTIYFKDGKKIPVSLKEKTGDEVKYKECHSDGPIYTIYKKDIYLIRRADGTLIEPEKEMPQASSNTALPECDKIYLKDGTEKIVYVVEKNNEEIKYKECGDKDGITYGIFRQDIIMIKHANGSYDVISTSMSSEEEKQAPPCNGPTRNKGVAFFLCLFLGFYGVHRFYLGYPLIGALYIFTFGLFGIGILIDLIRIATGDLKPKNGSYKKGGGIPL